MDNPGSTLDFVEDDNDLDIRNDVSRMVSVFKTYSNLRVSLSVKGGHNIHCFIRSLKVVNSRGLTITDIMVHINFQNPSTNPDQNLFFSLQLGRYGVS